MLNLLSQFIVDGVFWEYPPNSWAKAPDYLLRQNVLSTLDGNNQQFVLRGFNYPNNSTDITNRKIQRQSWKGSWMGSSFIPLDMRDHLETLYTLGKTFWIQYNDVESREFAQLTPINTNDYTNTSQPKVYATPSYPIAPLNSIPGMPTNYNNCLLKNGVIYELPFLVDSETGLITMNDTSLVITDIIQFGYSWKAFVRISDITLDFIDIPGGIYEGEIQFEQVLPRYDYDPYVGVIYPVLPGNPLSISTLGSVGSMITGGTIPSGASLASTPSHGWVTDPMPSTPQSQIINTVPTQYKMTQATLGAASMVRSDVIYGTLVFQPIYVNARNVLLGLPPVGFGWVPYLSGHTVAEVGQVISFNITDPYYSLAVPDPTTPTTHPTHGMTIATLAFLE